MSEQKELPVKVEAFAYKRADKDIKVLLLKRSKQDGGFWQAITGTLEFDESLRQCLLREIQEETGITDIINISDEVYRFDWQKNDYTVVELVYGVEVADTEIFLSKEHSEYKWCSPEEVRNTLEKNNNKKAFEEFLKIVNQ